MATTGGVRVLVVDDHRIFAEALAQRLGLVRGIGEVVIASSLGQGRALLRRHTPDLVLLDSNLGGEWGPALFEGSPGPRPRTLVVSALHDEATVTAALSSGADGFVAKEVPFEILLDAIDTVLRGELYVGPAVAGPLIRHLLGRRDARAATFVDRVSPRELEVLRCLVAGMDRAEVAAHLHISAATVRTHIQRLLHHAGVHSTLALVAAAREAGVVPTTSYE